MSELEFDLPANIKLPTLYEALKYNSATPDIVIVDDPNEPTPQALTKRYPWSKPKVQIKPTRQDKKNFKKLLES